MATLAYTLVQDIPAVQIGEDGIVRVTGDVWGLCTSPAVLTGFLYAGLREVERWQRAQSEARIIPLGEGDPHGTH